ncbi:MAG: hypothetical protein LBR44_03740 [Clostridiales Family XIII bacterium]|jgi:1-acyl-sn-glycerol-3-phosphate acyltransferase|nr:hypothetical protein [Clostridiales Family XIII bacterium]
MRTTTVRPGRKVVTEPFDRRREPPRQNFFLMPLIWLICFVVTIPDRLRIKRIGMKGVKPPFFVLSTHHSFTDFYVTPLALFPYRANYVSEMEGFELFGEWIYRQVGCLGTRKYILDVALIRSIKRVIERGDVCVVYPEARYCNVGTSSRLDLSVAKMAKLLGVPVVVVRMHGNYLKSPIWNLRYRWGIPLSAEVELAYTPEGLKAAADEEVREKLERMLSFDEYRWQYEQGIRIRAPFRAEGLEACLYKCRRCGAEFRMRSEGARLHCEACGASWEMTELGRLEPGDIHIPDWYEWQRAETEEEVRAGGYLLDCDVEVEWLPNGKNFVALGGGHLRHDAEGFRLSFTGYGGEGARELFFPAVTMPSVHNEYDYRGKGQCITLATPDDTWYLYPKPGAAWFNVTKIQFAQEYLAHAPARYAPDAQSSR